MKYALFTLFVSASLFLVSCNSDNNNDGQDQKSTKRTRFSGNYNKAFNDLHDKHIEAAKRNGIKPLSAKSDTSKIGDELVRIPKALPYFTTDKLSHSIPFLVPKASELLIDISVNFSDSLKNKGLPPYKLILTSITRTDEDIKKLTKRNFNASHNSAHCYGTTFDISWKRYEKINPNDKDVNTDKLKLVLGQVLYDLHQQDRCYIKHEKKQACFHITVR
ncbi:MAG: DUF5715 family protein [Dysgonomonas sp.]